MNARDTCKVIAIGGSAGALEVLITLLEPLPPDFGIPLIFCQHLHPDDDGQLASLLSEILAIPVVEAVDKMPIAAPRVHVAPADYHLLVERSFSLALSRDPKVLYSRPSIDLLFESATRACTTGLLGILLTGANEDGAAGLAFMRAHGGLTIAQDPATAESAAMPRAAVQRGAAALVLDPNDIHRLLLGLHGNPSLALAASGFLPAALDDSTIGDRP